jgi:hypothetical protein
MNSFEPSDIGIWSVVHERLRRCLKADEMVSVAKTIASAELFRTPKCARVNLFIRSTSISQFQIATAMPPVKRN